MARIKQLKSELEQQLKFQISFLISSCKSYDKGKHHEAKRIATILRTLFHKNRTCKPLLGQLQIQKTPWSNTATPYDSENLASHLGLTSFKFASGRLPCLEPKGFVEDMNTLQFDKWWTRPVVVSVGGTEKRFYSRQNLVLNIAETDGGVHVDEGLEEVYNELSRQNGLGVYVVFRNDKYPLIYPELPCMRQIGHEVLLTLKKIKPQFFDDSYDEKIESIHFGLEIEDIDPSEKIVIEFYIRNEN